MNYFKYLHAQGRASRCASLAASLPILSLVAAAPALSQTAPGQSDVFLEEIVITAEKRESTVQKTPISITAITGETLAAQGTTSMLEVAQQTPGVSFRSAGPGQTEFEIRGLASSGGATATVGYYLDDVPVSPPALGGIGKVAIDPNLYDLNRVEVLRGPQGTLYGSGSMGGTIKVVTQPAALNKWEAAADASLSSTASDGGTNWGVNAFANIPLVADSAAMRVVVSHTYNDGWIDRIVLNPFPFPTGAGCSFFLGCNRGDVVNAKITEVIPNSNWSIFDSARAGFLLQLSDALKVNATAMYQRTQVGGYSQFDSPPGPNGRIARYAPFNDPEAARDDLRLFGVTVNYDLGSSAVTSSTSYWNRSLSQYQDATESIVNLYNLADYYFHSGTSEVDSLKQFSQEFRLASTTSDPFQWLVGVFYSSLKSEWDQTEISKPLTDSLYDAGAFAPLTSADNPTGIIYLGRIPYDMKQYAGFADLSYQFSPALKLSVGGRYYNYDSEVHALQAGVFTQSVSAAPTLVDSSTKANGFNPKVNLAYTPTDDLTIYGTIAKGFRPGGVNLPLPQAGPNSCTASLQAIGVNAQTNDYKSDSVWSYEIGEKARLNEGRININSALYYIKWNDIQQLVPLGCGYFFTVNAGTARSYGSELEVRASLTSQWSVSASGAYTNASLNDPAPNLGIAAGSRLLNIPKYTAAGSLMYETPLTDRLQLTARAAATYTGSIRDQSFTYVDLPGYTLIDARIGILADKWTVYLSGTNLGNKVAQLTANNTALTFNVPSLTRISTNQPRTIGLNVGAKF